MKADPILRRIWRVQGKLARKAAYNPRTYAKNAKNAVLEIEKRYGLKFRYADAESLAPVRGKVAEAHSAYQTAKIRARRKRVWPSRCGT